MFSAALGNISPVIVSYPTISVPLYTGIFKSAQSFKVFATELNAELIIWIAIDAFIIIENDSAIGSISLAIAINPLILSIIILGSNFSTSFIWIIASAIFFTACDANKARPAIVAMTPTPAKNNNACGPITNAPAANAIPPIAAITPAIATTPFIIFNKNPSCDATVAILSITDVANDVTISNNAMAAIPITIFAIILPSKKHTPPIRAV